MAKKPQQEVVDLAAVRAGSDIVRSRQTHQVVTRNLQEYGLYVIEDRALPKVFDGLKPSQRRILWSLHDLKSSSRAVPIKCARVVGDTVGRFHPHGDASTYGTLVKLGWLHAPLVERLGNFGNENALREAPPAAARYTETRLSAFADHLFDDIEVVPMGRNYTEEFPEPAVLPARVPLLLVNGCSGIALAISTEIPPHNLGEVIEACKRYVADPDLSSADLAKALKGPDYGAHSGILLSDRKELSALYRTGKGKLRFDCQYHIEEGKKSHKLVITGKAPGLSATRLLSTTKALADKKLLVAAVYDDSTIEHPVRYVIEFTDHGIIKDRVLPLLKTQQNYQFYALDAESKPKRYDLKGIIASFVAFRRAVEKKVLRRQQEDLEKKLGTEQARLAAIQNLDWVVETLKSRSAEEAITKLTKRLKLEAWQAEVILNSQVRSLMSLNETAVKDRIKKLDTDLKAVVTDLGRIDEVVVRRLEAMRQYSTPRGTVVGKETQLDLSSSAPSFAYVGVTARGGFDRLTELPLRSRAAWPYVDLLPALDQFVVTTDANTTQVVSLNYLDQFNAGTAAVVGATDPGAVTVAVSADGHYVAFRPSAAASRKAVPVCRGLKSPLLRAVNLGPKDQLVVRFEDGAVERFGLGDLRVTRPNVAARRLGSGGAVDTVLVLRPHNSLLDETGAELTSAETLPKRRRLFVAGRRNVVVQNGTRSVRSDAQLLDLLERSGKAVEVVLPLPRPKKS